MVRILQPQFGQNLGKDALTVATVGTFVISNVGVNTTLINWTGVSDGTLTNITGVNPFHELTIINNSPNQNSVLNIANSSTIRINRSTFSDGIVNSLVLAKGDTVSLIFVNNAWFLKSDDKTASRYTNIIAANSGYCPWLNAQISKSTLSLTTDASGRIWFYGFYTPDVLFCRNFQAEITTAGTAISRMVVRIYADNSDFSPGATGYRVGDMLAKTTEISNATVGIKSSAFVNPVVLPRGFYWFAIHYIGSGTFRATNNYVQITPSFLGASNASATQVITAYNVADDTSLVNAQATLNLGALYPIFLFTR